MTTKAHPKLDAQTLEYVLSIIEEQEKIHEGCWKAYDYINSETCKTFVNGEMQADYELKKRVCNLIREQQEAE